MPDLLAPPTSVIMTEDMVKEASTRAVKKKKKLRRLTRTSSKEKTPFKGKMEKRDRGMGRGTDEVQWSEGEEGHLSNNYLLLTISQCTISTVGITTQLLVN